MTTEVTIQDCLDGKAPHTRLVVFHHSYTDGPPEDSHVRVARVDKNKNTLTLIGFQDTDFDLHKFDAGTVFTTWGTEEYCSVMVQIEKYDPSREEHRTILEEQQRPEKEAQQRQECYRVTVDAGRDRLKGEHCHRGTIMLDNDLRVAWTAHQRGFIGPSVYHLEYPGWRRRRDANDIRKAIVHAAGEAARQGKIRSTIPYRAGRDY
jgi:hypothetical protein